MLRVLLTEAGTSLISQLDQQMLFMMNLKKSIHTHFLKEDLMSIVLTGQNSFKETKLSCISTFKKCKDSSMGISKFRKRTIFIIDKGMRMGNLTKV